MVIRVRGWHTKQKKMYSPEEMSFDQLTILPTGQFINVSGTSEKLSTIFSIDKFIPLLSTEHYDKNRKEIFEGDLISTSEINSEYLPMIVKFGQHRDIAEAGCTSHMNVGFYLEDKQGGTMGLLNNEIISSWDLIEIVGNIYEKKELI